MIFSHGAGVPLYGLYIDPFWNFCRKSGTLFGIFVPNGGLQKMTLRAVFGRNGLHFQSKLGKSNQSIQSSFGLSFVPSK